MNNSWHEAFLQRTDRPVPDTPQHRTPASLVLSAVAKPLSWIYRASATIDRTLRYPEPIELSNRTLLIVVSSPVVGGVGKTPLVAHMAKQLADSDHNTAIVASGYGRRSTGHVVLDTYNQNTTARQIGDEPFMLHQSTGLPVHVDDNTASAIARLDSEGSFQSIILDNGIRRRWKGERRIVVFSGYDCERPARYLPDGRWRIAPRHAWPAQGVVVIEDSSNPDRELHRNMLERWGYRGPIAWYRTAAEGISRLGETGIQEIDNCPDQRPYVFSGLGRPSRFVRDVRNLGFDPAGITRFPDHHPYTVEELQQLGLNARSHGAQWLLTTHKDVVKIDPNWFTDVPIYYLRITLELTAGADMLSVILEPPT